MKIRNSRLLAIRDDPNVFPYLPNSPVDDHRLRVLLQLQLNVLHVHAKNRYSLHGQLVDIVDDDSVIL